MTPTTDLRRRCGFVWWYPQWQGEYEEVCDAPLDAPCHFSCGNDHAPNPKCHPFQPRPTAEGGG